MVPFAGGAATRKTVCARASERTKSRALGDNLVGAAMAAMLRWRAKAIAAMAAPAGTGTSVEAVWIEVTPRHALLPRSRSDDIDIRASRGLAAGGRDQRAMDGARPSQDMDVLPGEKRPPADGTRRLTGARTPALAAYPRQVKKARAGERPAFAARHNAAMT